MSTFLASKVMAGASMAYAGYALVRPSHLGRALPSTPQTRLDSTARVFGVRDLVVSAIALTARDSSTASAAALARIAFDVGDCLTLRPEATTADARRKLTAVTLGWAALNAVAYAVDRARLRSRAR